MSTISPHVLDAARSGPVAGVRVTLGSATPDGWWHVRSVVTDDAARPTCWTDEPRWGRHRPGADRRRRRTGRGGITDVRLFKGRR